MATVKYPTDIDTDAEIPRVDDNITEIGGEAINQLRAAVFAIEKALGKKPQGTAADVAARLGVSLDSNGNIKAAALSGIGLVTLPITNAQVGSAAGIEESKLDLNYNTALLKSWIDSLKARVDALEAAVAADIAHLAQHVAFPSTWGRHTTGDVDAYGVFVGLTAQGALTDLDTRLNAHIADPVDAHDGSAVSLDATRFSTINATNVQLAAEQLEELQMIEVIKHRDRQHGNGILGTQDTFVSGTKHGVTIIPSSATTSSSAGDTFIKFAVAPSAGAFQSIVRNDRIDFTVGGRTYTFSIESIQSSNQVNIFGRLSVTGIGTATVYRNSEEVVEPSVAVACMRKYDIVDRPSTIQIAHPSAPYILSNGFRGSSLSATVRNLRVSYPNGNTGSLDVYTAMSAFSSVPSVWTADNVAKVLNKSLFSPGLGGIKHPLMAFSYKGELGLAYDSPDGYISIKTPTANDATTALGFLADTIGYAMVPRNLYIDGYEIPSLKLLVDARGRITAGDTITFTSVNPLAAGVVEGQLARISIYETGTYVISDVTTSALVFDSVNEHDFSAAINKWVRVRVYADSFSVNTAPIQRTLYEVFLDGYSDGYGPVAELKTTPRVTYTDTSGGGAGLESILDIRAVSRTFGSTTRRVFYDYSARTIVMGSQVAGPSISTLGLPVTLPSSNEQGFKCSLYDANGVDYIDLEVANALPGSDGYLDITTYPRISEERFLQLATVLHDRTRFKHLTDTRQFGSVGRQDVRDDFTRDYVSYPRSLLRGNGVIYGFVASGTGTSTLTVTGGQALVNGQLKSVGQSTFAIPADGTATYNLFMDTDGALRLLRNDFFSANILSTSSLAELLASRTETALAQVVVTGSSITTITDVRRFVNDIDSKLDLLVEENGITHGSFASLAAAVAYLSNQTSGSPVSRKIRVRGEVILSTSVTLPDHVILEGDGYGPSTYGAKITFRSSSATIVLGDGAAVRNLTFYRSGVLSPGFLSGTSISTARIENCGFEFASQASGNIAISCGYLNETRITGCRFVNVGKGIWADKGSFASQIVGNRFTGVNVNAIVIEPASAFSFGANNVLIAENLISTASFDSSAGSALVRLESPWAVTIRSNMFTTTSTASAARQMLHIEFISYYCKIQDNFFGNTGAGIGFEKAIWFDGTAGILPHTGDTIKGNVVGAFSGGSANGIHLNNCTATYVSENYVTDCRTPLKVSESSWLKICDNTLVGIDDAVVLHIDGATAGEHLIIQNNNISSAYVVNNSIVELTSNAGGGGMFTGNIVRYTALAASYGEAILYVNGPEWHILNNDIGCWSLFGWLVTDSPITLSANADQCVIMQNNLNHAITIFIPRITIAAGATNVVEMLNQGQTYSVHVPITYARESRSGTGVATWESTATFQANSTTYSASFAYVTLAFGEDFVPVGATIDNVQVSYGVFIGTAANLQLGWFKDGGGIFPPSTTVIRASTNVSNSGGAFVETITPTTPPVRMERGDVHRIMATAVSGGTWTAYFSHVLVTYTL